MKPPHFIERLSLLLAAEEHHHGEELDGAVAMQAARTWTGLDGTPTPGN